MLRKSSFLFIIFNISFIYCQDINYTKACVNIAIKNNKKDCIVAPWEENKRCCLLSYKENGEEHKECAFYEDNKKEFDKKKDEYTKNGWTKIKIECNSNYLLKYINYIIILVSILFYCN